MKKIVLAVVTVVVVLLLIIFNPFSTNKQSNPEIAFSPHPSPPREQITKRASFAIFTNGTFRIFTDPKYHHLSSDVYLRPEEPNVIYVKKLGVTWDDFFKTLPMSLTPDCLTTGTGQTFCSSSTQQLKFYLNGQPDQAALEKVIEDSDSLLVSYGSQTPSEIAKQLQQIPIKQN